MNISTRKLSRFNNQNIFQLSTRLTTSGNFNSASKKRKLINHNNKQNSIEAIKTGHSDNLVVSSLNNPLKLYSFNQDISNSQLITAYPIKTPDNQRLLSAYEIKFNQYSNQLFCGLNSQVARIKITQSELINFGSLQRSNPLKATYKNNSTKKHLYSCFSFFNSLTAVGTYMQPSISLLDGNSNHKPVEILIGQDFPHKFGLHQLHFLNQYLMLSSARKENFILLWDLRKLSSFVGKCEDNIFEGQKNDDNCTLQFIDQKKQIDVIEFSCSNESHQKLYFNVRDSQQNKRALFAKGGSDGNITAYDLGTGECVAHFCGHGDPVSDVVLLGDEQSKVQVLSCSGTRHFNANNTCSKNLGNSDSSKVEDDSLFGQNQQDKDDDGDDAPMQTNCIRLWDVYLK